MNQLDHLVVTAADLASGCAYIQALLGVAPGAGGEHQGMATHNRLMRLGDSVYLEVIAPNPEAPLPVRARWFGMDDPSRLRVPRLATWVVRTSAIHDVVQGLGWDPGPIHPMQRGPWQWQITIPQDGQMQADGLLPTCIQWQGHQHPTDLMPASGCRLLRLELLHDAQYDLTGQLHALSLSQEVPVVPRAQAGRVGLRAVIQTPLGERVLEG